MKRTIVDEEEIGDGTEHDLSVKREIRTDLSQIVQMIRLGVAHKKHARNN